ncbi:MAG: ABC transporter substrate-binding protein [Alphaproteobacteria bacterium]|nr:ABC transporter substrate-binding protein [Alphaproteobacteria bacterium]
MKGAALFVAAALAAFPAGAAPRAVSLDFCADQYLLAIAAPEEIAAVSPKARGDDSYMREKARRHRAERASVESIAALKPDLVFRFWGGSPQMAGVLERFGARVVTLDYPADFETVRKDIRIVAAALHREERGEAMIDELDRRLAALGNGPRPQVAALYVTPGGVTAGEGTMMASVLNAAGVENLAAGKHGWPALPLESLVLKPPRMIVAGFFGATTEYVNNWSAARHPAFAALFRKTPTVRLDADLISCPAWYSVEAAEKIAASARKLKESRPDAEE